MAHTASGPQTQPPVLAPGWGGGRPDGLSRSGQGLELRDTASGCPPRAREPSPEDPGVDQEYQHRHHLLSERSEHNSKECGTHSPTVAPRSHLGCPPSGHVWPQEPKATLEPDPILSLVTTAFPPCSLVSVHSGGGSGMFLWNAALASCELPPGQPQPAHEGQDGQQSRGLTQSPGAGLWDPQTGQCSGAS